MIKEPFYEIEWNDPDKTPSICLTTQAVIDDFNWSGTDFDPIALRDQGSFMVRNSSGVVKCWITYRRPESDLPED